MSRGGRAVAPPDRDDIRAIVREELRRVLGRAIDDQPATYSTRKGHGPPGWSAESWRAVAPTIPGAYKPGRWTLVPRAAFETWLASRSATPAPNASPARAANDGTWTPSGALAAAGLRPTTGGERSK